MKKTVRLNESELVGVIHKIISEQQKHQSIDGIVNRFKKTINEQAAKPAVTPINKTANWAGFADYLVSSYYCVKEDENKVTYTMENKVTASVTFTQSQTNPELGAMSMTITFIDPTIVKTNGATISAIQNLLGARLANNSIVGNKPQGYLTQQIDKVFKTLFNGIKIGGQTILQIEDNTIRKDTQGDVVNVR
jgi:hypothetical protein